MLSSPRIAPSPPSIPGYQVLGQLGRGGMGLVYEVLDVERGVRLALKAMHSFGGAADVLRFKAEFRALRDLHHPNLVTLGELLEHEGKFFLTMERVLGEDFVRYVRGDPLRAARRHGGHRGTRPGEPHAQTRRYVIGSQPCPTRPRCPHRASPWRRPSTKRASGRPFANSRPAFSRSTTRARCIGT